jgi:hypothetical protein
MKSIACYVSKELFFPFTLVHARYDVLPIS